MLNILVSYFKRTKRTPVRVVVFLCPLLFSFIFIAYLQTSALLKGKEITSFYAVFTILACFSISFFVPMLYDIDKKAGNYANDLRCGIGRIKLFLTRFLFILLLVVAIELVATLPLLTFLLLRGITVSGIHFILCASICPVTFMCLIPIYQFVSLKYSYSGSILVGAISTLTAILLGTTDLGAGIWYFCPFVYPVKLIFGYIRRQFTPTEVLLFLALALFIALVALPLLCFWYNNWDGTTKMEE